jgi:hypothetical protein
MTEQEIKAMIDQLKSINLLDMIPQYKELPIKQKEAVLEAFQILVDKEKARLENEQ